MWKIIPNTNEQYSANDVTGEIRSNSRTASDGRKIKERILKPWLQNNGYLVISYLIDGKRQNHLVHREIAKTFLSNYSEQLDVNHLDCDKQNNSLSNLEMCSRKENIRHYRSVVNASGVKPKVNYPKRNSEYDGKSHHIAMISPDGSLCKIFKSTKEISEELGLRPDYIRKCCRGEQHLYCGYSWKYVQRYDEV